MKTHEAVKDWERAEIARSASEASHSNLTALRCSSDNIARYLNPPADTCYPLEYSYHMLGDVRGKSVLDFGCGDGANTVLLALHGARINSIDISADLIQVARKRLVANDITSEVHFFVGSAHNLPLVDESIDVVFGMAILHHLELPLVAREVYRVLRKGGRAIFQEPVRNSKVVWFIRNLIPYKSPDVSPFERPLTDAELKEFADGFSDYHSRAFMLPYVNLAEILPFARPLVKPLYRLDEAVLRRIPRLGYYATTRVIQITK